MNRSNTLRVTLITTCLLLLAWMPALSFASMVGTGEMLGAQQAELDRSEIQTMLHQEEAQRAMATLGVSPEQVEQRLASLTPAELSDFKQQLTEAPAGEGVVGVVVLFVVVFIITDMLCATDIFNFVRCIN